MAQESYERYPCALTTSCYACTSSPELLGTGHIQQLFIQTIRAIDLRACRVGSRRVSEVGFSTRKKNGYGCSFALRTDIRQISAAGPGGGEEGNSWPLKLNAKIPRSSNERPTNVCHIDTILHLLLITSTYSHLLCTFSSTYVGYTVVMTVPFVQVCGDFELD